MAHWLYQMASYQFSLTRYRTEVWEGTVVTNWGIGESKRRPNNVQPGELIILFYAKTGTQDPGIYGWGVITFFDEEVINFRPSSPSDYLKLNPVWDDEISDIVDDIRGGMPQGTMYEVDDDTLGKIREKISEHVFGV